MGRPWQVCRPQGLSLAWETGVIVIAVADLLTQSHCTELDSSHAWLQRGILIYSLSLLDHIWNKRKHVTLWTEKGEAQVTKTNGGETEFKGCKTQQSWRCTTVVSPPSLLCSSSSSSPLLSLLCLTDGAARAPSHPSVLALINQTIRLQLQSQPRHRWATSPFSRLPTTPLPSSLTRSKLTQINSDTQT